MMVATLLEPDLAAVASAMRIFDPIADAFEVRFDAFRRVPPAGDMRALTQKPLVATCRRPADGGLWKGEETDRLALLEGALKAGFDLVDIEGGLAFPAPEERLVRSLHDLRSTPPAMDLVRRAKELAQRGAQAKVATHAGNLDDVLHLLEAQARLRNEGVDASLMGLGGFPRALAHLLGARLVYGGSRSSAPGQPALKDIRHALAHWGEPAPSRDLYLVVGSPITHSLSPRIHNAAFREAGVPAAYGALEVETRAELTLLLERAAAIGVRGLSVTAPLKEAAYGAVERKTPEAGRARSVNCIKWDGDATVGHNTDGVGAAHVLQRLLAGRGQRPRVLLVGTGGAARGLLAEVKDVEFIVAGRTLPKMRAIENAFGVGTVPLERASHYFANYDCAVNATTVEEPVRLDGFTGAVFDLHYGAERTAWEAKARELGLPFAGGRELVLEQALPAFEFWTGQAAPRAAMTRAVGAPP